MQFERTPIQLGLPAGKKVPVKDGGKGGRRVERQVGCGQAVARLHNVSAGGQGVAVQTRDDKIRRGPLVGREEALSRGQSLHPDGQIVAGRGGAQRAGIALESDEGERGWGRLRRVKVGKQPGKGKDDDDSQNEGQPQPIRAGQPGGSRTSQDSQKQAGRPQ